jgi:uncharacterized protein
MVAAGAYRVGPHRQFLLLARDWAADGIPVMRFDYQGQGDSEGAGAFNREVVPSVAEKRGGSS